MVEVIQGEQVSAYADLDNRGLSGNLQRAAVSNLPVIDLGPFMRGGVAEDRARIARAIRSACIDIGFFYVTGHGFSAAELDAVLLRDGIFRVATYRKNEGAVAERRHAGFRAHRRHWIRRKIATRSSTSRSAFRITRELKPGEQARSNSRVGKSQWPARDCCRRSSRPEGLCRSP